MQPVRRSASLTGLACLLLALAAACVAPGPGSGAPPSVDRADRLLQRGDAVAAAQMYEALAGNNPPPARNDLAFAAARAWLQANRADDAQRAMELAAGMTPAQQFERELLRAEVAVARGQYAPAWRQVSAVPEPQRPEDASRLFLLQQQVALRAGQPLDAVRAGISRERVATSDAERARARRDLLADLRAAIDRGLRVDPAAARDALVRGWLEIGQIAAAAGRSPLSAPSEIARWRTRFPGHPAATIVTSEILALAERGRGEGPALIAGNAPVALLLPLTGRYAIEAALVRDGFQTAVGRMPETERPAVEVIDTGTMPVGAALQDALGRGAGLVVGPLTPDEVQTAFELRPAGLPLLLLNSLRNGAGGVGVYQYALSPEDEARQIARQITGAGHRNVLVLAPTGSWGVRVADAFTDELIQSGGSVIAQGTYDWSRSDFTAALTETITGLLGIDESEKRHQRVQQIISSSLEFVAYPRPDIDAIFVAGYQPQQAVRQINPLLRHYNAGDIPTYVTQESLDGDARINRDLAGMRLLDTPWTLDTVGPVADLRAATEPLWGAAGSRQSRLFAFGYDAATLAHAIRRGVSQWPLEGLTGRLQLTADGRIERSLNWARVGSDGSVQPFDPARP